MGEESKDSGNSRPCTTELKPSTNEDPRVFRSPFEEEDENENEEAEPTSTVFLTAMWLSTGLALIFFNKVIISVWDFHYPFALTFMHQAYATLITRLLHSYTPLLGSVKSEQLNWDTYIRKVPLLALAYASALVLGNSAYKYLSLSYIQMLKSCTPIPTWFASTFILGREKPDMIQLSLVFLICGGTTLASVTETYWSWRGFFLQLGAIGSDCVRMVVMDNLTVDVKLDTLSTLYYMSPLASIFICCGFFVFEGDDFFNAEGGGADMLLGSPWLAFSLFLNANLAMALNCIIVLFITNAGIMTMSLAGIAKDILVVALSVLTFKHSVLTVPQAGGYFLSVLGLVIYREYNKDTESVSSMLSDGKNMVCRLCLKIGRGGGAGGPRYKPDEEHPAYEMYDLVQGAGADDDNENHHDHSDGRGLKQKVSGD